MVIASLSHLGQLKVIDDELPHGPHVQRGNLVPGDALVQEEVAQPMCELDVGDGAQQRHPLGPGRQLAPLRSEPEETQGGQDEDDQQHTQHCLLSVTALVSYIDMLLVVTITMLVTCTMTVWEST